MGRASSWYKHVAQAYRESSHGTNKPARRFETVCESPVADAGCSIAPTTLTCQEAASGAEASSARDCQGQVCSRCEGCRWCTCCAHVEENCSQVAAGSAAGDESCHEPSDNRCAADPLQLDGSKAIKLRPESARLNRRKVSSLIWDHPQESSGSVGSLDQSDGLVSHSNPVEQDQAAKVDSSNCQQPQPASVMETNDPHTAHQAPGCHRSPIRQPELIGNTGRGSVGFNCCQCSDECDLASSLAREQTPSKANIYNYQQQKQSTINQRQANNHSRLSSNNSPAGFYGNRKPTDRSHLYLSNLVAPGMPLDEPANGSNRHNPEEPLDGTAPIRACSNNVVQIERANSKAKDSGTQVRQREKVSCCDAQSAAINPLVSCDGSIDINHNSNSNDQRLDDADGSKNCADSGKLVSVAAVAFDGSSIRINKNKPETVSDTNKEKEENEKTDRSIGSKETRIIDCGPNCDNKPAKRSHMGWQNIARRYGRMPHQPNRGQLWHKIQDSCFCRLALSTLNFLFPFFGSLRNYSLPGDLVADVVTGLTVAILHIPQGMAYGLLAGVEPIHGLYVSLVPVLVMAFMSKSPHMSYGTFAVISILLANCTESIKQALRQEHGSPPRAPGALIAPNQTAHEALAESGSKFSQPQHRQQHVLQQDNQQQQQQQDLNDALIITNNHKPADPGQQLLKTLLTPHSSPQPESEDQSSLFWSTDSPGTMLAAAQADFVFPTNIEILTCVCLLAGLIQVAMALMRLGVLSLVFSDQLVSSFTTASAVHVASSQLGPLFDLSVPNVLQGPFKVCRIWAAFGAKLLQGFNRHTALLSLASLLFLLAVKGLAEPRLRRRFKAPICIPSELILMSVLILCSWFWRFHADYGIAIVGHIPTDLPVARLPRLDLVPWAMQDALTVAVVSFAMNLSLAQVCAKKFKYRLNSSQELFALGTSNVVGSFFSCFPCASSLSRTAVQSSMNAKTQIASLVSCAIVVSIICHFAPFFYDLPRSTLSCIIVVALKGILLQASDLYENWRLSKLDALVWFATFMFVIAFDVTYGMILGILTSLSTVFYRLITPNYSILGQLPDTEIYVAKGSFVECNEIDHVKIFRFNSALCYLNREMFKSSIDRLLPPSSSRTPARSLHHRQPERKSPKQNGDDSNKTIEFLIVDCSALAFCDYSGVSALIEIVDELDEKGITVYLAGCSLKLIRMIEKLKRTNLLERNVYPSITDAVNQTRYQRSFDNRSPSIISIDPSCLKSVIKDTL